MPRKFRPFLRCSIRPYLVLIRPCDRLKQTASVIAVCCSRTHACAVPCNPRHQTSSWTGYASSSVIEKWKYLGNCAWMTETRLLHTTNRKSHILHGLAAGHDHSATVMTCDLCQNCWTDWAGVWKKDCLEPRASPKIRALYRIYRNLRKFSNDTERRAVFRRQLNIFYSYIAL